MKKLKKALSMALALTLSLAMAVPAFAAENNWNLEVEGKPDEEAFIGEQTFIVRGWDWSEYDENGIRTITKTDSEEMMMEVVCVLKKGETGIVTNGGEEFQSLELMAWSDPDGDGVYDNRLMKGYVTLESDGLTQVHEDLQPADIAGPLTGSSPYEGDQWYFNSFIIQVDGSIGSGEYIWSSGTELRLSADALLEEFGPNTVLWVGTYDGIGWGVILEGDGSAPSDAAAYKVNTSAGKGLNVRTGPGTNYKKVTALREGTVVQVVEVQGQWGKLANDAGWVFMPGLKAVSVPTTPTTPTTPETPEQTFPITMVVNNSKGALNVRTGPGANYKIATTALRNGSVITIDKIEGQWGRLANYMDWWVYLPGAKTVNG